MKTHSCIFSLIAMFVILTTMLTQSQEIVIAQHSGFNNPTLEGFTLNSGGQTGSLTNDLGMNAWYTRASATGTSGYSYNLTQQQQTGIAGSDWILSVTIRIVAPYQFGQYSAAYNMGTESFFMDFSADTNGDPSVGGLGFPTFSLTGAGSTYNNYQLIYDAETETADLWVNGIDEVNDISGVTEANTPSLQWGQVNPNVHNAQQANWSLVSLEIIPEPSTVSLIFLGSGVFIYVRARDKKHSKKISSG